MKNLGLYNKVIESNPQIVRKGKTMPYTSVNGHMFSFFSKEGVMGLRLSEKDRESFFQDFSGELIKQHGRVMKEHVKIPSLLLQDTEQLSKYLQKSFKYVSELKPKLIKRKK